MAQSTTQALAILFGAYGEANDVDRLKIYTRVLGGLPPALVEKAVMKTISEWKMAKLPPVGVVLANAESLNGSVNAAARVKTWEEAWGEIERGMYKAKEPQWSTPQVAAAVRSFGWNNLVVVLVEDMPTVRAQLRRFYEDACNRIKSQAHNDYLLGKNPQGILGIPAVAEVVARMEARK